MKLWDDVTKAASDAASKAAKKTSELTASAKLRYKLHTEQTRLSVIYEKIGRLYYDSIKSGIDNTAKIAELTAEVEAVNAEIARCTAKLAEMKRKRVCPACNAEIDKDSVFCPRCGTKQPTSTESKEQLYH